MHEKPGLTTSEKQTGTSTGNTGTGASAEPKPAIGITDAIAVIVGIVIGAGIFRTPSLVAANSTSGTMFLMTWVLGGVVSLIGALCYAELTTTYPNTGGDYHFLTRAFGKKLAFLFAWARMSIIQTGSIALLAFIIGDYLAQIYSIGTYTSVIYAALVVTILTAINITGVKVGTGTQKLLLVLEAAGLLLIVVAGLLFSPAETVVTGAATSTEVPTTSLGLAMVFVLLTFGGWNEAAYISAELRSGRKGMAKVMILSILIITGIYLLINLAYLNVLDIGGMARSDAVASDLMRITFGEGGVVLIGLIVAVAALTSANATIFTGARTNYALGRDFPVFSMLGKWNARTSAPVNAFIVQGVISLALIGLALLTRNGFQTMVEYTAPVFWFFLLLVGISVFVLRHKEPHLERPFPVPLYPLTPILFCLTSAYLLYSSLVYTGLGALVGVGVLLAGVVLLLAMPHIDKLLHKNHLPGNTTP